MPMVMMERGVEKEREAEEKAKAAAEGRGEAGGQGGQGRGVRGENSLLPRALQGLLHAAGVLLRLHRRREALRLRAYADLRYRNVTSTP